MEVTEELLGSLTTYNAVQTGEYIRQTVRTSARVIKKLRQDSTQGVAVSSAVPPDAGEKDKREVRPDGIDKLEKENGATPSTLECNVPSKPSSSAAKQRMPKALWSASEKNLFFEALNEHGKDFDSITAYICNKIKKKGVPDTMTKNKHQVSHFYYRTWQKVSKYVKFGDDVKKVVQELYTLINYGELRKRVVSAIATRTLSRLSELVYNGVIAVRAAGKTVRVRTPVCRALRRLNHLEEWEEQLRLPARVAIMLCPRDMEAWSRIHAAAHNPRVLIPAAPSRRIAPVLGFLQRRWQNHTDTIRESLLVSCESKPLESTNLCDAQLTTVSNTQSHSSTTSNKLTLPFNSQNFSNNNIDINLDPRVLVKKLSVAEETLADEAAQKAVPRSVPFVETERDDINGGEIKPIDDERLDESEMIVEETDINNKINNTEEQDSVKNVKWTVVEESKELVLHVGPKPGIEFNIPTVNVSEHITSQRICYNVYQERLGSAGQTNGSLCSAAQTKVGGRFKSHRRQRKDSGDADGNMAKKSKSHVESDNFNVFDVDETANDGMNGAFADIQSTSFSKDIAEEKSNDDNNFMDYKDKELYSEQEDEDKYNNETDGEGDVVLNKLVKENSDKKNDKSKAKIKTKKDRDTAADNNEDKLPSAFSSFFKKNWNRDILMQQVKKGWSTYDIGDLTIGDLYLMFGIESKLELNYWWAKPTLPFSSEAIQIMEKTIDNTSDLIEINDFKESEGDSPINNAFEDQKLGEKRKLPDQERLLMSPNHSNSMESVENEDLKKDSENSPDSKKHPKLESFNIASKIINNPFDNLGKPFNGIEQKNLSNPLLVGPRDRVVPLTTRLKKLLSLSQLQTSKKKMSCTCGHVCSAARGKKTNNTSENAASNVTESAIVGRRPNIKSKALVKNNVILKDNINNQNSLIKNVSIPSSMMLPSNNNETVANQDSLLMKQQENVAHNANEPNVSKDSIEDKFPTPYPFKKIAESPHYGSKKVVDLSGLPRWTKKKGRPSKQTLVVRKFVPISPWPPIQESVVKVSSVPVAVPSDQGRLPQLRPAPLKNSNVGEEKSKAKETDDTTVVPTNYFDTSDRAGLGAGDVNNLPLENISVPKAQENIFSISTNIDNNLITDGSSNISNLLDISLPSNIVDDNSLEVPILKLQRNSNTAEKHDDFAGLLHTESMSLSPSRLLKENESNWLGSEHDFSLSSFLGHLESAPSLKSEDDSIKKASEDILEKGNMGVPNSSNGANVDNQIHCLMSEASIDYMAKFADLAAQVNLDNTK